MQWGEYILEKDLIIDFHVHCFPDDIAARTVESLAQKAGIPAMTDGTVTGVKASMQRAGIDKSVLLNIATRPTQCRKITQWASSVEGNEIIAFGSIHPDCGNWKEELEYMKQAGLKGVKFHPDYQGFYVDEKRMYPIYEKVAEMGFVMVFHGGVDIGLPVPCHCPPERMKNVVRAFPGARIVAAHMGGYDCWDDVERFLVGEDVYLDTSFSLHKMNMEQFMRIVELHGFEKILFATDSPWGDQSTEVMRFYSMPLSDNVRNAILGGNAGRLLGLTC